MESTHEERLIVLKKFFESLGEGPFRYRDQCGNFYVSSLVSFAASEDKTHFILVVEVIWDKVLAERSNDPNSAMEKINGLRVVDDIPSVFEEFDVYILYRRDCS